MALPHDGPHAPHVPPVPPLPPSVAAWRPPLGMPNPAAHWEGPSAEAEAGVASGYQGRVHVPLPPVSARPASREAAGFPREAVAPPMPASARSADEAAKAGGRGRRNYHDRIVAQRSGEAASKAVKQARSVHAANETIRQHPLGRRGYKKFLQTSGASFLAEPPARGTAKHHLAQDLALAGELPPQRPLSPLLLMSPRVAASVAGGVRAATPSRALPPHESTSSSSIGVQAAPVGWTRYFFSDLQIARAVHPKGEGAAGIDGRLANADGSADAGPWLYLHFDVRVLKQEELIWLAVQPAKLVSTAKDVDRPLYTDALNLHAHEPWLQDLYDKVHFASLDAHLGPRVTAGGWAEAPEGQRSRAVWDHHRAHGNAVALAGRDGSAVARMDLVRLCRYCTTIAPRAREDALALVRLQGGVIHVLLEGLEHVDVAAEMSRAELRNKVKELKSEIERKQAEIERLHHDHEHFERIKEAALEAQAQVHKKFINMQNTEWSERKLEMESAIRDLEVSLRLKQSEADNLREELQRLQDALRAMEDRVGCLESELNERDALIRDLRSDLDDCERTATELRMTLRSLQLSFDEVSTKCHQLEEENRGLRQHVEQRDRAIKDLEASLEWERGEHVRASLEASKSMKEAADADSIALKQEQEEVDRRHTIKKIAQQEIQQREDADKHKAELARLRAELDAMREAQIAKDEEHNRKMQDLQVQVAMAKHLEDDLKEAKSQLRIVMIKDRSVEEAMVERVEETERQRDEARREAAEATTRAEQAEAQNEYLTREMERLRAELSMARMGMKDTGQGVQVGVQTDLNDQAWEGNAASLVDQIARRVDLPLGTDEDLTDTVQHAWGNSDAPPFFLWTPSGSSLSMLEALTQVKQSYTGGHGALPTLAARFQKTNGAQIVGGEGGLFCRYAPAESGRMGTAIEAVEDSPALMTAFATGAVAVGAGVDGRDVICLPLLHEIGGGSDDDSAGAAYVVGVVATGVEKPDEPASGETPPERLLNFLTGVAQAFSKSVAKAEDAKVAHLAKSASMMQQATSEADTFSEFVMREMTLREQLEKQARYFESSRSLAQSLNELKAYNKASGDVVRIVAALFALLAPKAEDLFNVLPYEDGTNHSHDPSDIDPSAPHTFPQDPTELQKVWRVVKDHLKRLGGNPAKGLVRLWRKIRTPAELTPADEKYPIALRSLRTTQNLVDGLDEEDLKRASKALPVIKNFIDLNIERDATMAQLNQRRDEMHEGAEEKGAEGAQDDIAALESAAAIVDRSLRSFLPGTSEDRLGSIGENDESSFKQATSNLANDGLGNHGEVFKRGRRRISRAASRASRSGASSRARKPASDGSRPQTGSTKMGE